MNDRQFFDQLEQLGWIRERTGGPHERWLHAENGTHLSVSRSPSSMSPRAQKNLMADARRGGTHNELRTMGLEPVEETPVSTTKRKTNVERPSFEEMLADTTYPKTSGGYMINRDIAALTLTDSAEMSKTAKRGQRAYSGLWFVKMKVDQLSPEDFAALKPSPQTRFVWRFFDSAAEASAERALNDAEPVVSDAGLFKLDEPKEEAAEDVLAERDLLLEEVDRLSRALKVQEPKIAQLKRENEDLQVKRNLLNKVVEARDDELRRGRALRADLDEQIREVQERNKALARQLMDANKTIAVLQAGEAEPTEEPEERPQPIPTNGHADPVRLAGMNLVLDVINQNSPGIIPLAKALLESH